MPKAFSVSFFFQITMLKKYSAISYQYCDGSNISCKPDLSFVSFHFHTETTKST